MGGGVEVVDEPRPGSDGGAHPERPILSVEERLEMVVDDGLVDGADMVQCSRVNEKGMAPETLGEAGDRGLGAPEGPGDLPLGGAGGQARGDGDEQTGALQVVGRVEGLPGAGAPAVEAAEAGDPPRVTASPVMTVAVEP